MILRILALLLLALAPAAAQQKQPVPVAPPGLPGIGQQDPRRTMRAAEAPWTSIGRVQTDHGGRCTGTLVAPDLVLTAAHCLVSPRTGQFVHPRSVHFLLAYEAGRFRAHGRVMEYRTGIDYDAARRGPARDDWALLALDRPLNGPVLPLLPSAPPPRTPVMLGGYQQDRPEVIQADTGCRVLEARAGLLLHDCAGTRGSSGAPVLARQGQGWAVAGVMSRAAPDMALGAAVAVEQLAGAVR